MDLLRRLAFPAYMVSAVAAGSSILGAELSHHQFSQFPGIHPPIFWTLAALMLLAELRPVAWLKRHEGGEVTASWAFAFALLLVAGRGGAMSAMAVASLAGDITHRKPLYRAAFNCAQFVICLAAGQLILDAGGAAGGLNGAASPSLSWLGAVTAAGAAIFLANGILTSTAIALYRDRPIWNTVRASIFVNLSTDGMLLALGPVFVVVAERGLILIPLLLLVAWSVYYSSYLALTREYEANHDVLTGSLNRRRFSIEAGYAIDRAERHERVLAVALIDLDGFKTINDQLGHHVGDLVLSQVASRIEANLTANDLAGRIGGDEFSVVFDCLDLSATDARATQLLEQICAPYQVHGFPVSVEASLGLAVYPFDGKNLNALLRHADLAMYHAKETGSVVRTYTDRTMEGESPGLSLLADLSSALQRGELYLEYQPMVAASTGRIVGVEALLRWNHPEFGLVPPDRFIKMAEHTDLISDITEFVVDSALAQLGAWRAMGVPEGFHVSVNASARNLLDRTFPQMIGSKLAAAGLATSSLEIEVTENAMMADRVRSRGVIDALTLNGVGLALDDFGTGFSSMANLRQVPAQAMKIDRSFVTRLQSSDEDRIVVATLVGLAHRLGLKVTAEGVEDPETVDLLTSMGCDFLQGFHLGRPQRAEVITRTLIEHFRQRPEVPA